MKSELGDNHREAGVSGEQILVADGYNCDEEHLLALFLLGGAAAFHEEQDVRVVDFGTRPQELGLHRFIEKQGSLFK